MASPNKGDALLDEVSGRLSGDHTHGYGRDQRQGLALQVDIALNLRQLAETARALVEQNAEIIKLLSRSSDAQR